ncbi:MAG TPA: hypothetical protein PLH94_07230 [Fimbriimonadaceae bacterium]|nr:hypothetical protein [Fimbriimonadaceae bacterium]
MKILPGLLLGLAGLTAAAQSRYGYTTQQILAMPPEKWIEVYAKKKGAGDPITDGEASAVYAACLRERYSPKLKRLPKADQARIKGMRSLFIEFKNAAFGVQYIEGGGGTLYSHLQRLTVIDDEQFTESLIDPARRPKTVPGKIVAERSREIDAWLAARMKPSPTLRERVEEYAAGTIEDLVRDARTASTAWKSAQAAIAGRPDWERAIVVDGFRQWTRPIVGE